MGNDELALPGERGLPVSRYREWAGPPQWAHVVLCRWEQRIGPGDRSYVQRVLPDGCADVIVAEDGRAVVVGPATQVDLPVLRPGSRVRGLRLRSEATRALLRVPASDLQDQTMPLDAVLSAGLARTLTGWLGESQNERATGSGSRRGGDGDGREPAAVHAWLAEAMVDDRVRAAARRLWSEPDDDVALVAEAVGLSGRQLRRLLLADLGLGPKVFQRVGRLQRFLAMAEARSGWLPTPDGATPAGEPRTTGTDWPGRPEGAEWTGGLRAVGTASLADLAAAAGYADQAHMSREVRALAGTTPARLLEERARATPPPGRPDRSGGDPSPGAAA